MTSRYELVFTREFLRNLGSLDRNLQIRILKELKDLENNPFTGKRLRGQLEGLLSLRAGDYRVVYELSENKILIRAVGHRRGIYKS